MGQEPSDLSSWDNWAAEPSERYVPRNIPEAVYEQNEYYDPPLGPGGDTQSARHINAGTQVVEGGQINSEDYVAAHLLYAIYQGEGP
jgi:hypothetical protein